MSQGNGKDIYAKRPDFMTISLAANRLRVIVVGGGRAGFIKTKTFLKRGCSLWGLSLDFTQDFKALEVENNITLIKDRYNVKHIKDKHIVIIATGDCNINQEIKKDCENMGKIYLTCGNGGEGLFFTPVQGETESINFSIHTLSKSPKTSLFLAGIMKREMAKYDGFTNYICTLRERVRDKSFKNEIMDFVNTKDFYEFYCLGVHDRVLHMFYGGEMLDN